MRGGVARLVLFALGWVGSSACTEGFDPRTLVKDVRILAIQASPSDLVEGEVSVLSALVAAPNGEAVEYAWEWCPVTQGPNNAFRCVTEDLGLDDATLALFDLGTESTAVLPYPGDAEALRAFCEQVIDAIGPLPDLAEVPDCELGAEVWVRLTVRAEEREQVAVKRLFLWFEAEPEPLMRNANPSITRILSGLAAIDREFVLRIAPGGHIPWTVQVDEAVKETFLVRDAEATETRREELLFSWFSTLGEWDRDRSFSDDEEFTLQEAGRNVLIVPESAEPGTPASVFFVLRDGRGGIVWDQRELLVVEPSNRELELLPPGGRDE